MTRRRNADCVLAVCDGSGWLDLTEDPDTEQERCPCGRGLEPPAEAAERLARVVDAEVKARRRAQALMNQAYNRGGWL